MGTSSTPDDREVQPRRSLVHPETPIWIPRALVLAALVFLLSGWVYRSAGRLSTLFLTLAVSFLLACAIEQPVNYLHRKGWRRGAATGLVMVSVLAGFLGLVFAIGALVAGQANSLLTNIDEVTASLVGVANDWFGADLDPAEVSDAVTREGGLLDQLRSQAAEIGLRSLSALGPVLMGLLFTFYLAADGPRLRRFVCSVMRPERQAELLRAWDLAVEKAGGYLLSRLVLASISSATHAIAFVVLDVPYAVALGLWMGVVSQVVPIVGSYLGGALPVMVALSSSPSAAVGALVVLAVYGQLENYVISPKITRRTLQVHPAVGLGSVVVFSVLFGPVASLLALPVVGTLQAFFSSYVTRHPVLEDPDHQGLQAQKPGRSRDDHDASSGDGSRDEDPGSGEPQDGDLAPGDRS